jgi:hypothetical protein
MISKELIDKGFQDYIEENDLTDVHPVYMTELKKQYVLGCYERHWLDAKYEVFNAGSRYCDDVRRGQRSACTCANDHPYNCLVHGPIDDDDCDFCVPGQVCTHNPKLKLKTKDKDGK